jgi:hypothetical protein
MKMGLGLSLASRRIAQGITAPSIPTTGLSLWLKADAGVTDFQIPAASGIIDNAADFEGGASNQYLENTNIEGTFVNTIVISGAGTTTSNGTYTRENGGTNQFFGPNGNYIYNDDPDWKLYDNDYEGITYSTDDQTFTTWQGIDGDSPNPSGVTYYSGFSISTWFKMKSHSSTPQTIWGTAGNDFISLYVQNGSVVLYDDNTGTIQGPVVSLDTWYHAVVTYSPDAGAVLLFIDGENSGSMDMPQDWSWTGFGLSDFKIDGGNHGYSADASIDETGIWTRVLTEGEISDLYNGGDGLSFDHGSFPTDGIKAYWKLDEASDARIDSAVYGYALTNTNQNQVITWADQSGNNNNAIANTGEGPTFVSSFLNNKPAIRFNGNGQVMEIADSSSLNFLNTSAFIVLRYLDNGEGNDIVYIKNADAGSPEGPAVYGMVGTLGLFSGNLDWPVSSASNPWPDIDSNINITDGTPRLLSMTYDGADIITYDAGEETSVTQLGGNMLTSTGLLQIGGYNKSFNAAEYFNGDVAEIIMYNRAVTSTERQQVEEYLGVKYAIAVTFSETGAFWQRCAPAGCNNVTTPSGWNIEADSIHTFTNNKMQFNSAGDEATTFTHTYFFPYTADSTSPYNGNGWPGVQFQPRNSMPSPPVFDGGEGSMCRITWNNMVIFEQIDGIVTTNSSYYYNSTNNPHLWDTAYEPIPYSYAQAPATIPDTYFMNFKIESVNSSLEFEIGFLWD